MNPNQIKEKIITTMSLVLEVTESEINEDSSTDTLGNWDSLRHLNLIIGLEEEFGISIADEEVGNMVNYKIIFHVINDTLSNGGN